MTTFASISLMTTLASTDVMTAKLTIIAPEILLFIGAVVVAVLGLSRAPAVRRSVPLVTSLFLALSIAVTAYVYRLDAVYAANVPMPELGSYAKIVIAVIGILLVMVGSSSVDRRLEEAFDSGRAAFDPIRVMRGEYFAFFLLALAGAMLLASTSDLIWLFLALELASLPTYVMVAVSRGTRRAQEAAVKYFFLGAMAAAISLYGFAMLYGATGTLDLIVMKAKLAEQTAAGGLSALAVLGGVLAILGISFKLAAVPMHFYAPDVYEGAASHTTAFIAFVAKIAGVLALFSVLSVFWTSEGLPATLTVVLWMVAVLTMTLGNIGALLQRNVKRMMAYSSIAHSGYILIGLLAGAAAGGYQAALFYLLCYGIMNTAIRAVLASLERAGEEVETMEDLAGLRQRHPILAWVIAASAISLIGMPPLLGFFAKFTIFTAGIEGGQTTLVIIAAVNSAISAYYYLQLVTVPMLGTPNARTEGVHTIPSAWPRYAAVLCGLGVIVLPIGVSSLVKAAAVVGTENAASPTADSSDNQLNERETASAAMISAR